MNIVILWAGGSGISNIAHLLRDLGYRNLVAIDAQESQITQTLASREIPLVIGHGNYQVKADDILIYSEATKDSPEVQSAFQLKKQQHLPIKIWNYFEFLGELSKYFRTVGFTGTNGKSSSTALAIVAWKELVPDLWLWIVGALVPDLDNKSYYLKEEKKSDFRQIFDAIFTGKKLPYELIKKYWFFLEACEYKRHFLNLDLEMMLITNIELDHTDYYEDIDDYCSAFVQMAQKTKSQIITLEHFPYKDLFPSIKSVAISHRELDFIRGNHIDANASLVAWMLQSIDPSLELKAIEKVMKPFKGIWRRMEFLKTLPSGAKLFSDYWHIASSLKVGYDMLKLKFPDHKIAAIFQPHQLHRVLTWRDAFKSALSVFDQRAIFSIYAARERLSDFAEEELFQSHHFETLLDFWAFFAKEMNADYLDNISEVKDYLALLDKETIVVIFTAWDLDFQLRANN